MPKINQNAYEGRSATAQRAGVVSLNQITAQEAALFSRPPALGNTTPAAVNSTINTVNTRQQVAAAGGTIGETVLVAGTVTIANTNIAATDRIFLSRRAANASTTMGELSYTISAATSFTINSLILGTPGSVQTGDLSTVEYYIVRQV